MQNTRMVTVEGRAYGPYSLEQMRGFIAEGRVVASSLIGPPGAEPYSADLDPELGMQFVRAQAPAPADPIPAQDGPSASFGRHGDPADGVPAHFVIVGDIKSQSIHRFEEAVHSLGQAHLLLPQVWVVTATHSLNAVRNTLVQKLGTLDALFIVDATHDKSAWYNFPPEAEARLRRAWKRSDAPARKSA